MADVTGPISTLPGAGHSPPDGMVCDNHPDRPAVARIQGETDSFGCEMHDLCAECAKAMREEIRNADTSGKCDWCGQEAPALIPRRDIDEGMHGRVYEVCKPCRDKDEAALRAELDQYDDGFGDFDDDNDDDHEEAPPDDDATFGEPPP